MERRKPEQIRRKRFGSTEKKCVCCKKWKSLDQYYISRAEVDGHSYACKRCIREHRVAYHIDHPLRIRNARLKNSFGITIDDYESKLTEQKGCCAICGDSIRLVGEVDHNHKTNQVRGLLCHHCNVGLGYFKENISNLQKAIQYLRKFS